MDIETLEWHCIAVRGDGAAEVPGLDAEWPGIEAVDVVGVDPEVQAGRAGTLDDYERARIEAAVPAMGAEITSATIPAELGVTERSVSFTKGCYTGQELVARIDSRGGNVPRHLYRVDVDGPVGSGSRIEHDGREVGEVTSSVVVEGRTVGLAIVARSVIPPADVTVVAGAVSYPARVRPAPA